MNSDIDIDNQELGKPPPTERRVRRYSSTQGLITTEMTNLRSVADSTVGTISAGREAGEQKPALDARGTVPTFHRPAEQANKYFEDVVAVSVHPIIGNKFGHPFEPLEIRNSLESTNRRSFRKSGAEKRSGSIKNSYYKSQSAQVTDSLDDTGFHQIYGYNDDDAIQVSAGQVDFKKELKEIQPEGSLLLTMLENLLHYHKTDIICVLYVAIGMAFFTTYQKLSILHTVYFIVVTTTTVGYGDISPKDDAGRLFTTFYIIIGVSTVLPRVSGLITYCMKVTIEFIYRIDFVSRFPKNAVCFAFLAFMIIVEMTFGISFMMAMEEISFIESLYWCVVTGFSVGYGDISGKSGDSYHIFAIFFIISTLCVISGAIAIAQEVIAENKRLFREEQIKNRHLSVDMLLAMDKGGPEGVDKLEFVVGSE